jgi:hypothetical protein
VVLAVVGVLCGGVVAVPVVWVVRGTIAAGQGEATPDAAVNVYLLQTSAGEEIGLRRVLAPGRRDDLLRQWRAYRADMTRSTPPDKLSTAGIDISHQGDDRAAASMTVRGTWWSAGGGGTSMVSGGAVWRFEVRRDRGGWRVWSADLPAWCGTYVRVELCR